MRKRQISYIVSKSCAATTGLQYDLSELYSKSYTPVALGSGNLKIDFILLTKVIALHMHIIVIKIGVSEFEKPIKFVPSFAS